MVKRLFYIICITFFICRPVTPQNKESISDKNQELNRVKNEISALENELKSKTKKERESIQSLENLNRQKLLINKLIITYKNEEEIKSTEIEKTESQINNLENKIMKLKKTYSDYVVWLYKNRTTSAWRYVFRAGSYSQAIMRYKYFDLITEQNEKTLSQLIRNKNELADLKTKLVSERLEKENLLVQKTKEQETLTAKEIERRELITALKNDKKSITAEIDLKRMAEIAIKNMIAKLVEEERERRSRLKESKTPGKRYTPSYDYGSLADFSQLKGRLAWPISSGKIVRKFGENKNVKLKTVTLNYGIDLEVKAGTEVRAVAEGIVSAIDWIPGYGSVLIITHRDEFRTVYGHVSDIKVTEGAKINAGVVLGSVNESLEGNILHFEIWNERNYQNPEVWLTRK